MPALKYARCYHHLRCDHLEIIEQTARASYGKLLAILTKATSGDIALAEDCLSSAFAKALETWPDTSVPQNPEAWLVKTAKNLMIDSKRHNKVQSKNIEDLLTYLTDNQQASTSVDYRLELLFVCAHPAIDSSVRTPLMLQAVMGFTVDQIAPLFLVSPGSLEKKLTRAKQKIKLASIPFSKPETSEMTERLQDVLEAIYGVFGKSWDLLNENLEEEAVFLARIVSQLLPEEPEPKGLLSLLLYCQSRKSARRYNQVYIPLFEQNTNFWDHQLIQEAESILSEASKISTPGRFQYEAAIQSAQLAQILNKTNTNEEITLLYQALLSLTDTIGAKISFAAFLLRVERINEAVQMLSDLEFEAVKSYQPYWVLKGEVSLAQNNDQEARLHLQTAIGLTDDPSVRSFLLKKMEN